MIYFPILMFKHFVVRKTKSFIRLFKNNVLFFSKLLQKIEYGDLHTLEGWSHGAP